MDQNTLEKFISNEWVDAVPTLMEYIKIPNTSPDFGNSEEDKENMHRAMELLVHWIKNQNIDNLKFHLSRDDDLTPFLLCTLEATDDSKESVLFYQHMDKQPPLTDKWTDELGPYKPVIRDGNLYGRGSVDDGYAIFGTTIVLKTLQKFKIPHGRIVIMLEASEESGSCHLKHYIDKYQDVIGKPDLVVCLDSGGPDFDRLWITSSLRGCFLSELTVKILDAGIHSGDGGGVVPDPFSLLTQLLNRLYDPKLNQFHEGLTVEIPERQTMAALDTAKTLGKDHLLYRYPLVEGVKYPNEDDLHFLCRYYLQNTWSPTVTVVGIDGFPSVADGGNVIHPEIRVKLSMRLPPTKDPDEAIEQTRKILESDPPFGCQVTFEPGLRCSGWVMPSMSDKLQEKLNNACMSTFGKPVSFIGEGGSIPIINMLGQLFPESQMIITGAVGPDSNMHGPDESLNLKMAEKVMTCLAKLF